MRIALFAACLTLPVLAQVTPAPASAPSAKTASIKKLMDVMEVTKNQITAMKQALEMQKGMNPMITQAFVDAFMAEVTPEKLEATFLPIFEKNLTEAEVKALLAFYATPEGASFVKKQGVIQAQSMEAGQRMGMEVGMKVMQKLQAEAK